jgi:hypothetical protein
VPSIFGGVSGKLGLANVLRLHALLPALGRLVGDLLALVEGLVPLARYPTVVHEDVFTPVVRGDETVALLIVEPFDRSLGHVLKLIFLSLGFFTTKRPPLFLPDGASQLL